MTNCNFSSVTESEYKKKKADMVIAFNETQYGLINMLFGAYWRLTGANKEAPPLLTEGDRWNACDEIYALYAKKYVVKREEKQDNRGISKNVTYNNVLCGTYHFDKTYEKRQFLKYLVKETMPARNEDFLAFILHTAVAFLLTPRELDTVLKLYGFQQLHGRNIHHLAIYAVLSQAAIMPKTEALTIKPFERVKSLYEKAREILTQKELEETSKPFLENYTQWSRKELFAQALQDEEFFKIIREHKSSLTMRHKTILDDHHKFAALFRYIFDKSTHLEAESEKESDYSFYAFTNNFCCGHSEKKFREKIFDQIDKYGKHPTRELMICFWLYALCFAWTDGVYLEDRVYKGIVRTLRKYDDDWAKSITKCYRHSYLNVVEFIEGEISTPKSYFCGLDMIDYIRSKISLHYEWGTLDNRNPFDYCIGQLAHLEFIIDDNGHPLDITYKGQPVHFAKNYPDTVPGVMVVIFEFLKHLKHFDEYPLACNLYEQI